MSQKRYLKRAEAHISVSKPKLGFTFEQAYEYYLNAKKAVNVRPRTLDTYSDSIRLFTRWIEGFEYSIEYVDEVSLKMVRQYINYLRYEHFNFKTKQKGISLNSINAQVRFLKVFFSFLEKEGYVDNNVMLNIDYLKVDQQEKELLTEDELDRLINIPNDTLYPQFRDKVIMYLAYDSCLRINELISLDIEDLRLKERKIILPASKAKGRKQRTIPITSMTLKMLLALIEENNLAFNEPKAIFLNWHGERLAIDTFRKSLSRYVKKAGIEKEFSCHGFRRQGITDMLKNGVSLFVVQKIVGHEKIETTRRYAIFDEATIFDQHNRMSPMNRIAHKKRRTNKDV